MGLGTRILQTKFAIITEYKRILLKRSVINSHLYLSRLGNRVKINRIYPSDLDPVTH
jgi:hypothetical protein